MPYAAQSPFQVKAPVQPLRRPQVINVQRPVLRLARPGSAELCWIRNGRQGSLQTASEMARLVREDIVKDEGLERWVVENLLLANKLDSHSPQDEILDAVFRFVQRVPYVHDPSGSFDSVSSARQVLRKGYGDCDDLSVLLATFLALIGFRPEFVLAKYHEDQGKGFDHIYVSVQTKQGRVALDPTTRQYGIGWESPKAIEKVSFPIFAGSISQLNGQLNSGMGDLAPLLMTGAQVGLSFIPGVGGILATLLGPVAGLFSRKQQRAEETTRDQWKDQVLQGMTKIQQAVDSCQITRSQGTEAANQLRDEFYKACDQNFTKSSVSKSCRNFESQDFPGGPQQGNFKTHTAMIQAAGVRCLAPVQNQLPSSNAGQQTPGSSFTGGAVVSTGAPGSSLNLTTAILLIGGGILAVKAFSK